MTTQWVAMPNAPTIGSVLYIATNTSRRRAVVIAIKPGFAMLRYALTRKDAESSTHEKPQG
jgi:hypothetical protein